jgi:hypothetical protein
MASQKSGLVKAMGVAIPGKIGRLFIHAHGIVKFLDTFEFGHVLGSQAMDRARFVLA